MLDAVQRIGSCRCGLLLLAVVAFPGATDRLEAGNTMRLGSVEIDPGDDAVVPVLIRTDVQLHAFSLAFSYPSSALAIEEFSINTAFIDPNDIGYSTFFDSPGENYALLGTVLMWNNPASQPGFPPTGDAEECLGWIRFTTEKSVQPAPYPLIMQNNLGSPPVQNSFSSFGITVVPSLTNGVVDIRNNNRLRVESTKAVAGGPVTVYLTVDHKQPIAGLQVSVGYDSSKLTLRPDLPEADSPCNRSMHYCGMELEELLLPFEVEQFLLDVNDEYLPGTGWAKCAMIFDYQLPFEDQVLPPGTGQTVLAAYFTTDPSLAEGTTIDVTLVDTFGDPVFPNKFLIPIYSDKSEIVQVVSIFPLRDDGVITVVNSIPAFRRGFLNGDDGINIADAVFLLQYLFSDGAPPACLAAADVNDDGGVNLTDVVALLTYLYSDGAISEPFEACGYDRTPDQLGCDEAATPCL